MRNSDRWITPGVIVALILVGGGLIALLLSTVAYLAARGVDPAPMLTTVGVLVTGAGTLVNLLLQLATRATTAKTERNTGVLAASVYDMAEVIPRPGGPRHASPDTNGAGIGAAPVAPGS